MTTAGPAAVAEIIGLAGGKIVGRTRLQKAAFLLEAMEVGFGFPFVYHFYGPYSDELTWAARDGAALNVIKEEPETAAWGGKFSIFRAPPRRAETEADVKRACVLDIALGADAVTLELAATAAFLAMEGEKEPWTETELRKPQKAKERIADAKALYARLAGVAVPQPLPRIVS